MKLVVCALLLAGMQDDTKPTPAQKAAELLRGASESVSTATPAVQVAAMIEMAQLYRDSDAAKAMDLLKQALSAAGAVPVDSGAKAGELQARVVRTAAEIDVDGASEMVQGVPVEWRVQAVEQIVTTLAEKEKYDRAIEVLELNTGQGAYPYRAADLLLKKLAADDGRRVSIFGAATAALDASKGNDGYTRLLARHWRTLPRPLVDATVTKLVNGILDQKSDSKTVTSLSSAKGSANFDDNADYQLFDLMVMLEAADPKKAAELREKRPQLDAALKQFPEGRMSMMGAQEQGVSTSRSTRGKDSAPDPGQAARMRMEALASAMASEAVETAKKDVEAGIRKAREVPDAWRKAGTLARIATMAAGKDQATAAGILGQVIEGLKEVKEPEARAGLWAEVADAALAAKDEARAREAIEKGLADCAELYKKDIDAENPNVAAREYWPSMQHFRSLLWRAAKAYGVESDLLLEKTTDADLQLMGRIELARSLMGKGRGGMQIWVNRGKKR